MSNVLKAAMDNPSARSSTSFEPCYSKSARIISERLQEGYVQLRSLKFSMEPEFSRILHNVKIEFPYEVYPIYKDAVARIEQACLVAFSQTDCRHFPICVGSTI